MDDIVYLNDDPTTPIYQRSAITERHEQTEILWNVIQGANRDKVCSNAPYRCLSNSAFIIAADGSPTWLNRSNTVHRYDVSENGHLKECDTGSIDFRTTYYAQKSNTKITQQIIVLLIPAGIWPWSVICLTGRKSLKNLMTIVKSQNSIPELGPVYWMRENGHQE